MKNLTKDELRVISRALSLVDISDLVDGLYVKEDRLKAYNEVEKIQEKVMELADDQRRKGRKSINHFEAVLKRLIKQNDKSTKQ